MDVQEHLRKIRANYAEVTAALEQKDFQNVFLAMERRSTLIAQLVEQLGANDDTDTSELLADASELQTMIDDSIRMVSEQLHALQSSAHVHRSYASFRRGAVAAKHE
ncbi:hypothetical protein JI721_11265 [Alicyclobacillus cycloheptanicus]|uniref:Flagellar protein FliT n=1 Tax=Alicyclobacillus cycloheptanicus TaxID=1457 RepID=A0ABT9XLN5_9BACL|nr:hypothetical protein [Alicyclobacillus cycloheptanicus]MDQ0190668.1 hypothetical protein [Alicyclobacillus cycloheptanicus]WDM00314.1 hypothetical protein JI721_11265 [Alicyclobacillus cycloheptanicus]